MSNDDPRVARAVEADFSVRGQSATGLVFAYSTLTTFHSRTRAQGTAAL